MSMQETAVNSLVQAVEVWRPDASGERLEWCAAAYGDSDLTGARSARGWSAGEGFIGRAMAEKVPVIHSVESDGVDDELSGLSLSRLVAIPTMQSGVCKGVTVLMCNDAERQQGAIEVWQPNERSELTITDGWYANLERFGLVSKFVKFPRRAGLPGRIWEHRFPRVMGSLGASREFVRVAGAKADGLSTAIGIPFMRNAREIDAVMLLLSAQRSPIATVMEVWAPDPNSESGSLRVVSADYGPYVDLDPMSRAMRLGSGEGVAGKVFADGMPWASADPASVEAARSEQLSDYGFEWAFGLPIYVGDDLFGVVTLMR